MPSLAKSRAKQTGSEDESSDPEPGVKGAKKDSSSESEDSASDSESGSGEDEDVDMADASAASALVPTNGLFTPICRTRVLMVFYLHTGKRKADTETAAPPKKTKLANGDAAPVDNAEKDTQATTVFVGHLSWNVDNDWLKSEFEECGEVVGARVQMDRNTGKSRGFAYVEFADPASVEKALALSGKEIDGRAVNVDRSTSNKPSGAGNSNEQRRAAFGDKTSPPSSVLFVGNLAWGADENSLWDVFAEYGDVKSVRVPTDRETGKVKGFAYVEFSDIETAKKAFTGAQGMDLQGRNLRLDYSQPRDGGGGGGRGGGGGGRGGGRGFGRGFGGGFGGGRGGFDGGRGGRGGFDGGRVSIRLCEIPCFTNYLSRAGAVAGGDEAAVAAHGQAA
jgi:nucleolin